MNLTREIHTLEAELCGPRQGISCARLGRTVRETECTGLVLAADAAQLLVCLACPEGHKRAFSAPFSPRQLLPLALTPAQVAEGQARPTRAKRGRTPKSLETMLLGLVRGPVSVPPAPVVEAPLGSPAPLGLAPRLADLARVLREFTADGRMRVSMLDLMRGLGAVHYDEAGALVEAAGLRTSRLYGPVQAVLVDFKVRQLLERADRYEVSQ